MVVNIFIIKAGRYSTMLKYFGEFLIMMCPLSSINLKFNVEVIQKALTIIFENVLNTETT